MIANNKMFVTLKWKTLQKYLPEQHFKDLIIAASQKYIISTNNYLEAAIVIVEHIFAKDAGLDLLTSMLIAHFKEKKIYTN